MAKSRHQQHHLQAVALCGECQSCFTSIRISTQWLCHQLNCKSQTFTSRAQSSTSSEVRVGHGFTSSFFWEREVVTHNNSWAQKISKHWSAKWSRMFQKSLRMTCSACQQQSLDRLNIISFRHQVRHVIECGQILSELQGNVSRDHASYGLTWFKEKWCSDGRLSTLEPLLRQSQITLTSPSTFKRENAQHLLRASLCVYCQGISFCLLLPSYRLRVILAYSKAARPVHVAIFHSRHAGDSGVTREIWPSSTRFIASCFRPCWLIKTHLDWHTLTLLLTYAQGSMDWTKKWKTISWNQLEESLKLEKWTTK